MGGIDPDHDADLLPLKLNTIIGVGRVFPAHVRDPGDWGGENPPLRWNAWLHLMIKDH
jgi:hypothetical protein